jgi:hypothetical protein
MDNEETVVAEEGTTPEGEELEETTGSKEVDGPGEAEPEKNAEGEEIEGEGSEGADAIRKGEIKGLPEEAQQAVNRRIGKVVAREKAAAERAETAEKELETARKKLEGGFPDMVKRLGLHGELVSPEEAKQLDRYGKLKAQKAWCRKNEDGYEGGGADDPSVNAATVREKLSEIEDELDELAPAAREIQVRIDKQTREIWAAGVAALKKGKTPTPPAQQPGKKVVKPPSIPGGSGSPKAPTSAKKSTGGKFNESEFKKSGGNKTSLEKQFEKLYG